MELFFSFLNCLNKIDYTIYPLAHGFFVLNYTVPLEMRIQPYY